MLKHSSCDFTQFKRKFKRIHRSVRRKNNLTNDMAGLEQDQHRPRLKIIASVSRHDGSAQTGFTFLDSVQSSTVKRCVDRVGLHGKTGVDSIPLARKIIQNYL